MVILDGLAQASEMESLQPNRGHIRSNTASQSGGSKEAASVSLNRVDEV